MMWFFVASEYILGMSRWSLSLLMPGLPRAVLMVRAQLLSSLDGLLSRAEIFKQKPTTGAKIQQSRPSNKIRELDLQASWAASQKSNLRCLHNTDIQNVDRTACSEGILKWVDPTEQDGNPNKIPPKSLPNLPTAMHLFCSLTTTNFKGQLC